MWLADGVRTLANRLSLTIADAAASTSRRIVTIDRKAAASLAL